MLSSATESASCTSLGNVSLIDLFFYSKTFLLPGIGTSSTSSILLIAMVSIVCPLLICADFSDTGCSYCYLSNELELPDTEATSIVWAVTAFLTYFLFFLLFISSTDGWLLSYFSISFSFEGSALGVGWGLILCYSLITELKMATSCATWDPPFTRSSI